jgi:hypothetical protein
MLGRQVVARVFRSNKFYILVKYELLKNVGYATRLILKMHRFLCVRKYKQKAEAPAKRVLKAKFEHPAKIMLKGKSHPCFYAVCFLTRKARASMCKVLKIPQDAKQPLNPPINYRYT